MSQKEHLIQIKPTGGKPRIPTFSPEYMSNPELHENVRLHDAARIEAQRIHDEHVRLHDVARIEAQRIHEENVRLHDVAQRIHDENVRLHDETGKFRILFDVNEISYELFMFIFTVLKERTILVAYKSSKRGQSSNATGFFSNKLFIK